MLKSRPFLKTHGDTSACVKSIRNISAWKEFQKNPFLASPWELSQSIINYFHARAQEIRVSSSKLSSFPHGLSNRQRADAGDSTMINVPLSIFQRLRWSSGSASLVLLPLVSQSIRGKFNASLLEIVLFFFNFYFFFSSHIFQLEECQVLGAIHRSPYACETVFAVFQLPKAESTNSCVSLWVFCSCFTFCKLTVFCSAMNNCPQRVHETFLQYNVIKMQFWRPFVILMDCKSHPCPLSGGGVKSISNSQKFRLH